MRKNSSPSHWAATAPMNYSPATIPSARCASRDGTNRWCRARFIERYRSIAAKLPVSHRYMSFDFRLKRTLRGLGSSVTSMAACLDGTVVAERIDGTVRSRRLTSMPCTAKPSKRGIPARLTSLSNAQSLFISGYICRTISLSKVDRASMLHSLEVRAPFLDIDVVDFLRRLPAQMKLSGGVTKYILRRAARTILPREVIERGKQGFAVPIGSWLRDDRLPHVQHAVNPKFFDKLSAGSSRGSRRPSVGTLGGLDIRCVASWKSSDALAPRRSRRFLRHRNDEI